jgi:hypothetical protein
VVSRYTDNGDLLRPGENVTAAMRISVVLAFERIRPSQMMGSSKGGVGNVVELSRICERNQKRILRWKRAVAHAVDVSVLRKKSCHIYSRKSTPEGL